MNSAAEVPAKCPAPLTNACACLPACVRVCVRKRVCVCVGNACGEEQCDSFLIVALSFSMENCGIYLMFAFLYHYSTYTHTHRHRGTHALRIYGAGYIRRACVCVFPTNLVTTPQGVPADDHQQPLPPDSGQTETERDTVTLIYIAPCQRDMSLPRVCVCVWGSPRTPLVFTFVDLICNSSNNFECLSTRSSPLHICVPPLPSTPRI